VRPAILGRFVIVAKDIQVLLETVERGANVAAGGGRRARRVFLVGDARQLRGNFQSRRRVLFADFIADAPEDDAGMIAVAAKFRAPVFFMPVVPQQVIIVPLLAVFPAVERFVHHHHAQAVAQIEQLRRGRIVAGADGVAAHGLQDFNLPFQRAGVDGRAERAEVVMVANAVQRHASAVQKKSVVRRELNRADAEGRFITVHHFAVLLDGSDDDVALRRLNAPQFRIGNDDLAQVRLGLAGGNFQTPAVVSDPTDFPLSPFAASSKISFFTVTTESEFISLSTLTRIFTVAALALTSGVVT
jgi:hypothetical protein